MTARDVTSLALFLACLTKSVPAKAGDRWVDARGVLPPNVFQVGAGVGAVLFTTNPGLVDTRYVFGDGLNFEGAVGIGHAVEVGARWGARPFLGRGLRADEVARLGDTETFGTGLSTLPNPEIRARWRAILWAWGEAGIEDRVALPLESDRQMSEVLGTWVSLHTLRLVRLDAGFNGVLALQSLAGGTVIQPAFGVPVRLWANLTRPLLVGLIATTHHFGSTSYTSSYTQLMTGFAVGYRIRMCDILLTTYSIDVLSGFTGRIGTGLAVACRL